MKYDPWETASRKHMREDFLEGLDCYEREDLEGALELFRAADEQAEIDDIYQNRYTSFHGLVRVLIGDESGVKLCRKAAVGEQEDVDVYYNLAMAESKLGIRGGAYMALRRGLTINPEHPGLVHMSRDFNLRARHPVIPWLSRNNVINRLLGKVFRKRGESRPRPG